MKSRYRCLILALVYFCLPLTTEAHYLRDSLRLAEKGDFLVTIQGKMYTLLHIAETAGSRLVIEEVAVPKNRASVDSWRSWIENGAPGHSAWSQYEIDISTGQMLEFYSVSQRAWSNVGDGENFLSTLLYLKLHPLSNRERKRVGPKPIAGQMDRRRIWQPRLVVDGEQVPGVQFNAWRTYWPRDGSELSGKMIDLYLPQDTDKHLAYFPAWLEVAGTLGRAQLRIIDSGKGLKSPHGSIPRRPPQLMRLQEADAGALDLTVQSRPYYNGFSLLATPVDEGHRYIELSHQLVFTDDDEIVRLVVDQEELQSKLEKGKRYRFTLQPNGYPEALGESRDPWLWR